jgi:hypothetical protein
MPLSNEFNENLRDLIATNIPCVHMPTKMISEKVLRQFASYLEGCKIDGFVTIDDVLQDMKNARPE